jgi:hypothetical protein
MKELKCVNLLNLQSHGLCSVPILGIVVHESLYTWQQASATSMAAQPTSPRPTEEPGSAAGKIGAQMGPGSTRNFMKFQGMK